MGKLTFKCCFHLYLSLPGSYWYTKTHFKVLPPLFLVEAERAERPAPHTHRDQLAADVGNQLYYIFMRWPHPLPPLVPLLECRHFFSILSYKIVMAGKQRCSVRGCETMEKNLFRLPEDEKKEPWLNFIYQDVDRPEWVGEGLLELTWYQQ